MYRTIHCSLWTDPKVKRLDAKAKLVFMYLITGPQAHVSGIYYLPRHTIAHEVGLTIAEVGKAIHSLSVALLILEDAELDVIWVRNMLRHQRPNPKIIAGIGKHLGTLHNSKLINAFLGHYNRLGIVYQKAIHTISRVGVQEQEQDQDKEQEQIPPKPPKGGVSVAFEQFWQAYPRRVGKGQALKAWEKIAGAPDLLPRMLAVIAAWAKSEGWAKDGGKFIPHPATWLNGRRWEDDPPPECEEDEDDTAPLCPPDDPEEEERVRAMLRAERQRAA